MDSARGEAGAAAGIDTQGGREKVIVDERVFLQPSSPLPNPKMLEPAECPAARWDESSQSHTHKHTQSSSSDV
jgi:hypothetical protein